MTFIVIFDRDAFDTPKGLNLVTETFLSGITFSFVLKGRNIGTI